MTLRVLVVHNRYRSENPSGENLSVQDEIAGLRELGWDVEVVGSDSDVIGSGAIPIADLAVRPVYSRRSVRRVHEATGRFRPHVALVENLFPLHSPAVIRVLRRAGVPVVAGVRSYRMTCVRSTYFRDGAECRDCRSSLLNLPAVRHGCYQGSTIRSIPMAASLRLHRPTFAGLDAYLAVSGFVRDELVAAGFDPERIVVRPNFTDDPGEPPPDEGGTGFVFAGRLTDDKGVVPMIDAWVASEAWRTTSLTVIGSGPLEGRVTDLDPSYRVTARGLLPHDLVLDAVGRAAVTVVPSMWPEPFGRGVIEAAARARPSLVTASGGVGALVEDGATGWVVEPTVAGLTDGFRRALDEPDRRRFGAAARARFLDRFTRERSLGILDAALRDAAERGVDLGGR